MNSAHIQWVRACIGGLLAEIAVFAIVFPAHIWGSYEFYFYSYWICEGISVYRVGLMVGEGNTCTMVLPLAAPTATR